MAIAVTTRIDRGSVPPAAGRTPLSTPGGALRAPTLPAPVHPGFAVPAARALGPSRATAIWAAVREGVIARAQPGGGGAVARVSAQTPEGTTNIVTVLGRLQTPRRGLWVHVSLAALPNGTTGWVPRTALGGYGAVDTRLIIDRRRLTASLLRGGRRVFSAPVGVGAPGTPTPTGDFYIRDVLTRYSSPAYGPIAFGTSARSATLTDWPAGGYIGIHGTDQPALLPGRVSHGCIRMRNPDILRLAKLMPVGTPITIR